jgi:hypothetical protein
MVDQAPAPPSPYRTRNRVLAVVALVVVVGAAVRLVQSRSEAPAGEVQTAVNQTLPASPPASDGGSTATADAIDVEVAYRGTVEALPATAKVYVFIRPVGERMPLAVQSYAPGDLPVVVAFSNPSGAAAAKPVEAVARLSLSGSVMMQPGDTEVVSGAVEFGATPQQLSLTLGDAVGATPGGLRIPVHIALGDGIEVPPTATVFLVVREAGGSPMPLAVKRLQAADLPTDIELSDADAMVPGRTLGAAGAIELVARVSRSGDVKPAPGDWEARSGTLATDAIGAPIQLVIAKPL